MPTQFSIPSASDDLPCFFAPMTPVKRERAPIEFDESPAESAGILKDFVHRYRRHGTGRNHGNH
jgi:hypothetical protein